MLQFIHFIIFWLAGLWQARLSNILNVSWQESRMDCLKCDIPILVVSSLLLAFIVLYFWHLRNKPQFEAFFIKRVGELSPMNNKRDLASTLALGTSISLASISLLYYNGWTYHDWPWWSPKNTDVFYQYYPLIIVVCVSVLLYFVFSIKQERVQRSFPLLLFVPIILSIYVTFQRLVDDFLGYYAAVIIGGQPQGAAEYMDNVVNFSFLVIILTSFFVLFYLTYYYSNIERKKFFTLAEGGHLQGLIEEGVWILPKKVRENDSHTVSLELKLSKDFLKRGSHVNEQRSRNNFSCTSSDYLEAELQAVGINVDDQKRLRICENSLLPITTWSCSFTKSGIHTMNLMISIVTPDNSRRLIFMQNHAVNVDSFLSISWAPIVTLVTPILIVIVQVLLKVKP